MYLRFFWAVNIVVFISFFSCSDDTLFKLKSANETGIHFNNEIEGHLNDTFNVLEFEYMYNGAGVATGDLNNDGLMDLFFAGNLVSGKLYLNEGNLKFRDVTEEAKITTDRWGTGVSMVDINNDGWLDIYICVAGPEHTGKSRRNYFFINQGLNENGVPEFVDMAAEYGLDDPGYSTMAAFFDYDRDNDLDVYIVTNAVEEYNRNNLREKVTDGSARSTDRFYRNNGDGTFTTVNEEAGVLTEGWGLGICIVDFNQDGWPDIYVANDFVSNDFIWINQQNGTFIDKSTEYLKHQTHNAMGVDIADYNNDMLPDIVILDMLPESNYREKMMIASGNYDKRLMARDLGYQDQYIRNTLQLNQGIFPDGSVRFSEIAFLSGISKTDWSWAPLVADYDNDGLKDLFVANGYRKDIINMDFILYNNKSMSMAMFGTEEAREQRINKTLREGLDRLEEVKLSNYIYKNKGDLTFEDVTKKWGLDLPSFSNGAIYADLDNDGDLDIVINNIDDKAMVYENTLYSSEKKQEDPNNFLRISLSSENNDQLLYGSKVWISTKGKRQYIEFTPYRGYKSSVEPFIHFGTGKYTVIDSAVVVWPDERVSVMTNIQANQVLSIDQSSGIQKQDPLLTGWPNINKEIGTVSGGGYPFTDVSSSSPLGNLTHSEKGYDDFKDTPMLHHLLSILGPYAAVGDLNGDNLDDIVVGNDPGKPTLINFQDKNGHFTTRALPGDSIYEDRMILIFDADQDGDNDIYVVSGGSEWLKGDPRYQDRLYINDGSGGFTLSENALPAMPVSGITVQGADIDNDGDIDLFVGGYLVPREYPYAPQSYILINENGVFTDKTDEWCPEIKNIGMVTDAKWADLNNDQHMDLVVVGEWMPVSIFLNDGQEKLTNSTSQYQLDKTNGWYHSVHIADLNSNGYPDIVVGNTGLNSYYKASEREPIEIFAKDYDETGSVDPIMTQYNQGKRYISFFRDRIISQINGIKGRFQRFDQFANATFEESFTKEEMQGAYHLKCNELSSFVLENTGEAFIVHPLPLEAQLSAIKGVINDDYNNDGIQDLLIVGNSYEGEPIRGDYNASYGLLMLGNSDFSFRPVKPSVSGFVADGFCHQIVNISINGSPNLFITRNNDTPLLFDINKLKNEVVQ